LPPEDQNSSGFSFLHLVTKQEEELEQAEQRQQIEEENRNRLLQMARSWREARVLRRFSRACETVLAQGVSSVQGEGWELLYPTELRAQLAAIATTGGGRCKPRHSGVYYARFRIKGKLI
jgi:hypothetical protein